MPTPRIPHRSLTDRNDSPKLWASSYLPGYERPQLESARDLIGRHPEAHRPFHSSARVAYLRLSRHLETS